MQTKIGGGNLPPEERGDCVPACISSILGLPIDAIGNCHGKGWWDGLQAEVAKYGYCIAVTDVRLDPPRGYWVASVPSLSLPPEPDGRQPWHCVVARGWELIHDPCLQKRYDEATWASIWKDDNLAEGWVLAPLDAAFARERVVLAAAGSCEERRFSEGELQDLLDTAFDHGRSVERAIEHGEIDADDSEALPLTVGGAMSIIGLSGSCEGAEEDKRP
jgi:hypothetical protein